LLSNYGTPKFFHFLNIPRSIPFFLAVAEIFPVYKASLMASILNSGFLLLFLGGCL